METTTVIWLGAIILVFIFITGPTTAYAGKSSILSEYKSNSGYSKIVSNNYAGVVKPDFSVIYNPIKKPDVILLSRDTTIYWDPAFMNQTTKQSLPQSIFGSYMFTPKSSGGCACCG
jgi:hypothetical protein